MNFELSDEQRAYTDSARDFARAELAPHAAEWDRDSIFPKAVFKKAGGLASWGCTPRGSGWSGHVGVWMHT